ncbi:hypothetical protein CU098_001528 [Rhizopus stolonifer]|uniref:Uncharacterized protein n=1 Tax=Rhizopus stolonifer TaxID=4846 RepID=A0A367JUP0_RHIST|nr:hypothetical protein CU098_001528 [Rhizopus stolonifer]
MSNNNDTEYNTHECPTAGALGSPMSETSSSTFWSSDTPRTASTSMSSPGIISSNTTDSESSLFSLSNTSSTTFASSSRHFYSIVPLAIDKDVPVDDVFEAQNKMIKPFELSTKKNEIMLFSMHTGELQTSIVEIWCRSQLHDTRQRLTHIAWYNWVMLDIARRLNNLSQRMNGNTLIKETISEISKRLFYEETGKVLHEGKRFCSHPLFSARGRGRLLRLANKFGDAVCALSEFVDFMRIMKMQDEEFLEFYEELLENKWAIGDRMRQAANFFHSKSPLGPFTGVRPLV